jgi:hypothetical protein
MDHGKEPHVNVSPRPFHVKAGFKSTEFLLALLVIALATLIVGVQVQRCEVNVTSSVAIASAALTSIGYSRSRSQAKSGR